MEKERFYDILMVIGILLILLSPLFLIPRILEARHFCKSVGGTYFHAFNGKHYCNNEIIEKYYVTGIENKVFWEFQKNSPYKLNLSNLE